MKKSKSNNIVIIVGVAIVFVVVFGLAQKEQSSSDPFLFFGKESTVDLSGLNFIDLNINTNVQQQLGKACKLKQHTLVNYKGRQIQINSAFDDLSNPQALELSEPRFGNIADNVNGIPRIFCQPVKDLTGKDHKFIVQKGSLTFEVWSYDITKEKSIKTFTQTKSIPKQTLGYSEIALATFEADFAKINSQLPKTDAPYQSTQRFKVWGYFDFTIEGGNQVVRHTIDPNAIANEVKMTATNIKDKPLFSPRGCCITFTKVEPRTLDINGEEGNRRLTVEVTLDKWTSDEGVPTMKIFNSENRNDVVTSLGMDLVSNDGINAVFRKQFIIPTDIKTGEYWVDVLSPQNLLEASRAHTPSTIEVIDTTPTEDDDGGTPDDDPCKEVTPVPLRSGDNDRIGDLQDALKEDCPPDNNNGTDSDGDGNDNPPEDCNGLFCTFDTEKCLNPKITIAQIFECYKLDTNGLLWIGILIIIIIIIVALHRSEKTSFTIPYMPYGRGK